jgi:Glucosyltransferase 24
VVLAHILFLLQYRIIPIEQSQSETQHVCVQTEKQRIIWAYKILFLDVLFPLNLKKVRFHPTVSLPVHPKDTSAAILPICLMLMPDRPSDSAHSASY